MLREALHEEPTDRVVLEEVGNVDDRAAHGVRALHEGGVSSEGGLEVGEPVVHDVVEDVAPVVVLPRLGPAHL